MRADDGTPETARTRPQLAGTTTSALFAPILGTQWANALRLAPSNLFDAHHPKYLRNLIWTAGGKRVLTTADASLTQAPLPDVPESEHSNPTVNATLKSHPHLFSIVTPIHVDHFEALLDGHPNPAFVRSVLRGLREGFWPWASSPPASYPVTWDEDWPPPGDEATLAFLREQRDEEIALGRFSAAFGPDLLPGMYCMPIHAVSKPHSDKLRLVNDHSAGQFSLNSLITHESIKGVILDGIPALGESLRALRRKHGAVRLIMWKSDVSQAYRHLPMSVYWQIKQVATFDRLRYVDQCNLFGSCAGQRIFAAFMCLVVWIAVVRLCIEHLNYVDDSFGFELDSRVEFYLPYRMYLPAKQAKLLCLWDQIGLPHERKKQECGPVLTIIGFDVDPNAMTVTLLQEGRIKLLEAIRSFTDVSSIRKRCPLAEFQSFAGYANWAFNVYPLLKPGLCNLYSKMAGKDNRRAGLFINAAIVRDLNWMASHIESSSGIHFLDALEWGPEDLVQGTHADEFALVDASGTGMGLYFPWLNFGFLSPLPFDTPTTAIFFFEAYAIASALHRISSWRSAGHVIKRIAILSDNTDAVSIFNTLRALPDYNPILMLSVDILLHDSIQLRVDHIAGVDNEVADALSHNDPDHACRFAPGLRIFPFTPPLLSQGVGKNEHFPFETLAACA
ncbi:hypothetical protein A0H81_08358 [Grifola frondosa]|uniref:Reverse transcriptase domain-containing protein n=1 Tax=Grifola frondosa TaxID=5627 RepID=A0A1C7M2Y4_GRIFR|nr:hypothetical protein A0H81_08358 [Grifola frondosa]